MLSIVAGKQMAANKQPRGKNAMKTSRWIILTIFLTALMAMAGCGHMTSIEVSYQAPEPQPLLAGRTFNLSVTDNLQGQPLLGEQAASMLPYFSNLFVLTINRQGKRSSTEGGLDLSQLFLKALTERLETLGATVSQDSAPGTDIIRITIDSFTIEKSGRKWTGSTSYEASYQKNGKTVRQEAVKAEVERLTILGPKSVNTVASDLVETAVNKLDLERLLTAKQN